MNSHELGEQWLCQTCKYCQDTQAPTMVNCELSEIKWEPAIHATLGCRSFVNAGVDDE